MEPAATRQVLLMDVLIATPYPPYLPPFLANGKSLEVGSSKESAVHWQVLRKVLMNLMILRESKIIVRAAPLQCTFIHSGWSLKNIAVPAGILRSVRSSGFKGPFPFYCLAVWLAVINLLALTFSFCLDLFFHPDKQIVKIKWGNEIMGRWALCEL